MNQTAKDMLMALRKLELAGSAMTSFLSQASARESIFAAADLGSSQETMSLRSLTFVCCRAVLVFVSMVVEGITRIHGNALWRKCF
jgi:hypothetical protein